MAETLSFVAPGGSHDLGGKPREVSGMSSGSPSFANVAAGPNQYISAASAKRAGRLSAALTTSDERDRLLKERQQLLDKKFAGVMTKLEENRLSYVRWTLDRIEDALYGPMLDEIEAKLLQYEHLRRDIASLQDVLHSSLGRRQRA
jgi:hypothetical protein